MKGGLRVPRRVMTWLTLAIVSCVSLLSTELGATASAASTSVASRAEMSTVQLDSMNQDISTAVDVVNQFWASHWPYYFTGRYSRPRIFGAYGGGGRRAPYCDGARLGYNNAWYCGQGHYIAWDITLMRRGYRSGDAWVYLIIAHEWGHAVQALLDQRLVSRAKELQADCLAGVALYGAARDGILRFENGDVEELADALGALADKTPWTRASDHGSASQRIAAFTRGAGYGVYGCLT
ncbi:neutral zinc metallopeptidase [Sphaerisporangium perillae]|uniref:neutral zinc metallopeptidase n=1 Tax=Sphaerisporangium perillae TaxID=2935860 RepID=UPI0027E090A9|nr:neutral zinc metallopeptidase [Sphaerisporangium perillae]